MKYLKTLIPIILLISISAQNGFGQKKSHDERRAELIQAKKSYIEESVSFSSIEAPKFWKIFDAYHDSRHVLMQQKRNRQNKNKEIDDATADKMLDTYLSEKREEMNLHIDYLKEVRSLLGAKRVLQLEKVERRFNKDVLKTLKAQKRKGKGKKKG